MAIIPADDVKADSVNPGTGKSAISFCLSTASAIINLSPNTMSLAKPPWCLLSPRLHLPGVQCLRGPVCVSTLGLI